MAAMAVMSWRYMGLPSRRHYKTCRQAGRESRHPPARLCSRRSRYARRVRTGCEQPPPCLAMDEFALPGAPEELWREDSQLAFRVETFTDLSDSSAEEIGEIAESEAAAGGSCCGAGWHRWGGGLALDGGGLEPGG